MDIEALSHSVGPLSRDSLIRIPHHVLPSTNLNRKFLSEKNQWSNFLFQRFPYSAKLPVPLTPISKASQSAINGIDPVTSLSRDKMKWEIKKEKLIKLVRKDKNSINGRLLKKAVREVDGGKAIVPQGISMLAQHLDNDPDPCFAGASNWYYTGGTLATLEHNEDQFLLHSNQSRLNYTQIINGESSGLPSTLHLAGEEPVFQILSNKRGAIVRRKSTMSVVSKLDSDDQVFQLTQVHNITEKRHSFLSVALPEKSLRTFCTLTNNGTLKLWDLKHSEKAKVKIQLEPEEGIVVTDRWRQLCYQDKTTILMADKCCLHLLDARADLHEEQNAWCPKEMTEMCEQLSYIVCSTVRPHMVYLATSHQLLALDLRQGFCQRWTHLLAAPPHLGFTEAVANGGELVCLGSQIISECVAVLNTWGEAGEYMPTRLPSPAQSLLQARRNGLCLEPALTHRCTHSMTGLTCLSGLNVVRQSSSADTFIQQLTSSSQPHCKQLTNSDLTAFSHWAKPTQFLHREPSNIISTDVKDFSGLVEALTTEGAVKEEYEDNEPAGYSQRLSKKYLEDCVDLLARQLLTVWDVEDEEEWGEDLDQEEEQDPAEKVLNWLDTTADETLVNRNTTELPSCIRPTVTSTPFPVVKPLKEESPTEPNPWMTNPGQVLRENSPLPISADWDDGDEHPAKRQKLYEEDIYAITPQKPQLNRTQKTSTKKKFIPGF